MSTNYGLNSARTLGLDLDLISGHRRNSALVDFSNSTHYQLEYLDLSAGDSDGNSSGNHGKPKNSWNAVPLSEAEFYSFEDYLPASTIIDLDYENVYTDNNNHLTDENNYSLGSPGTQSCYYLESQESHVNELTWKLDSGGKNASRTGSTCSGSSTSSQSLGNSQPLCQSYTTTRYNDLSSTSIPQQRIVVGSKVPLGVSTSASTSHSVYDMYPAVRKSLSTDSFKKLHHAAEIQKGILGTAHSHTKVKSDNQQVNRTEELLNGIVKLAEDSVDLSSFPKIKISSHQPKIQSKRKPPLQTSKSTPLLSAAAAQQSSILTASKSSTLGPVSPINTHKRFPFSRKGSFHSSADHEHRKVEKKNKLSEKTNHINTYLDAVERFDIEKVTFLLASDNSYINSVNSEGLTALDMAVLTNHVPMIKILKKYGAETKFLEDLMDKNLLNILEKWESGAEKQMVKLKSGTTGNISKDNEKKLNQWEFKHRLFRRMKTGYEHAGLPGQPQNVKLSVTSESSLCVRFDAPESTSGAVVTRYKVEWSEAQNFRPLVGEVILNELHNLQCDISGLNCGTPYYVRVTAWNIKGFGRCSYADPLYAIPSSWRDVEKFEKRMNSFKLHKINKIIENVRRNRNCESTSTDKQTSSSSTQQYMESPQNNRKSSAPLMRGLRGLFTSSFKFQKSLKRGVYLACVCYHEDRILVTTEENLPIVEVDENYNSNSLQSDFDWLMKVLASSWDTARQLKQDLEKLELSSMHLRNQLLTAVLQLQELMGMQDLGQLFYKPIYDGNGSVVLVVVEQVTDPKQVGNIASAVRWQSQNKLTKNSQPSDPLIPLLNEMIFFHQVSTNQLGRGLYLGYLHIKFNTESVRVLAPENNPSALPFIKIRDCPNVSKPEWHSILGLGFNGKVKSKHKPDTPDILTFKNQLVKSTKKLGDKLGIPADQLGDHRIYDVEVLDFSENVSFILLMPPRELVASVKTHPTHTDSTVAKEPSSEYMEIPIKAFEMIHLHTYHNQFVSTFSKSACLVDSQLVLAQQSQREAFSNEEIESSRKQVESARTYHQQLEEIWRSTRWLADAISYARDRDGTTPGVNLTRLYNSTLEQSSGSNTGGDSFGKHSDDGYHSDKLSLGGSTGSEKIPPTSSSVASVQTQKNTNNNNGQYYDGEQDYHHQPVASEQLQPGILRVFAAYNSGLTKGTSVMLHVTPRTTAREVIDLVVMQLNKEVVRKGMSGPIYVDYQLLDFCLVAVIGPRERVLRDDYKLLQLQNPWIKGKLYVRLKDNLLAALEHGETTDV